MSDKIKFEVKPKPLPIYNGRLCELRYAPVECPFEAGSFITLNTGESGTIYKDTWGNSAYLRDDGNVYIYFKPENAIDDDDVEAFPLSYFGDFELSTSYINQQKPEDTFNKIEPKAWISINTVSGDETLAKNKVTSSHSDSLYQHKALYEVDSEVINSINKLKFSLDWYKNRVNKLQELQSKMRDPERTIVCDILANGHLLNEHSRYQIKNEDKPKVEVAKMTESNGRVTYFVYLLKNGDDSLLNGFQLFSSQNDYEANYYADDLKHYLGLGPEPDVLNYGPRDNV